LEAEAGFEKLLSALLPSDTVEFERNVALANEELGEEALAVAWAEGRKMNIVQAIKMASKCAASVV
jgi:hypothetical protein